MLYNDGFPVDDNLQFIKCPNCDNEEFSLNSKHCKICGFDVFNYCLGYRVEDENGIFCGIEQHKNTGNARYCETCGEKTILFNAKLLRPYTEFLNNSDFEI
ncbi:MAG: hypothetical protein IKZ29_08070 [Clostridiales bacterium]|nr:hypothetical protein [Clostridiales bacterium]